MGNSDKDIVELKGEENYRAWEYRTRVVVRAANLLEMLMGDDEKPNRGPSSKTVKAWKSRRDAAMEMLVKHLEDEVLTHAKGFDEDLIVAVMLNSIAEYPSFGDLIMNLESLKEELEVDNVELRIIWKVKNLKDDGRPESGGVPMIAGCEAVALAANSKVVQCENPKCRHMGHTIEECFREGGKKEGQYLEWYLRLRRNDGSTTQATSTSNLTNHYAM
ncbi:hypothetical protein Moror_2811 [Moniliophthora roreri MCA 2997]|uniref:Uncharacterized protein n=2 Tax=Moniliophthora roreri TaxID=221103 RepID=V2XFN9_MONRO|nr:hypothetical protein Moror_2811 [Moniliophthora roreri MCA 2997]